MVSSPVIVSSVLVFIMACGIFSSIVYFDIATDIQAHNKHIANINVGESAWPANFLYYYTVGMLSGFSTSPEVIAPFSIAVLAFALAAKYLVTLGIARTLLDVRLTKRLCLFAFSLLFVFPLPNMTLFSAGRYYIGQITPTVWHNSTIIFLFPFALLLFWQQFCALRDDDRKKIGWLVALVLLTIVIKPSFFLAFLPATAMMLLMRFGLGKAFWVHSIPLMAGLLMLIIQYFLIYKLNVGAIDSEASGFTVAPFAGWLLYVPGHLIPTAFLTSFLFPIAYFVTRLVPLHYDLIKYAVLLMGSSMLIFLLFAETGPRGFHGNFGWQNVICSYLLIFVMGLDVYDKWTKGNRALSVRVTSAIFIVLVLSGFVYLGRFFTVGWF